MWDTYIAHALQTLFSFFQLGIVHQKLSLLFFHNAITWLVFCIQRVNEEPDLLLQSNLLFLSQFFKGYRLVVDINHVTFFKFSIAIM